MAKVFIVFFIVFILGLILLTQVVVPLFLSDTKLFWLFRKDPSTSVQSLENLNAVASKNKEEREAIKQTLSSAEQALQEIKSKTN